MKKANDHDLLIELNTRFDLTFGTLTREIKELNRDLNTKFGALSDQLSSKAEKSDVESLKKDIEKIDKRVVDLEQCRRDSEVKHKTVIEIGHIGLKGWALFIGGIIFLLTIADFIIKNAK